MTVGLVYVAEEAGVVVVAACDHARLACGGETPLVNDTLEVTVRDGEKVEPPGRREAGGGAGRGDVTMVGGDLRSLEVRRSEKLLVLSARRT